MINCRAALSLLCFSFLSLFASDSLAQTSSVLESSAPPSFENNILDSRGIELPTEIYQIRPNQVSGPRFDLELPDGLSCSSANGTPPALNFYGGSTRRDNSYQAYPDYVTGGHSIGAVLSVPLAKTSSPRCDEAYNLYLTSKKIELIETLYDSGVLSDSQVQSLALKSLKELGFDIDVLLESTPALEGSSGSLSHEVEPFVVDSH